MSEAVIPPTDYAFDRLGFVSFMLTNATGNLASRRIKEKSGARLVRTEPAWFVDPAFAEREIWRLDRDDWRRFRRR